jgi:hypothetical protein
MLPPGTIGVRRLHGKRALRNPIPKVLLMSVLVAGAAAAQPAPGASRVDTKIIEEVRTYLKSDIVQMSVNDQNHRYRDRDIEEIRALDNQWRTEISAGAKPLISATLSNPLSTYLTRLQAHSNGLFTEIFVMDNKGLNVGQSTISSDYWQGDEDKWQKTYSAGAGAIFIDEPEYDAKLRVWLVQVNMSVDDPRSGAAIGAATFQVNLSEMQRRR